MKFMNAGEPIWKAVSGYLYMDSRAAEFDSSTGGDEAGKGSGHLCYQARAWLSIGCCTAR